MSLVLSIDWDFFWDVDGTSAEESGESLSSSSVHASLPPTGYASLDGFWSALRARFILPPTLHVAESHLCAARVFDRCGSVEIINFDSHHDVGYPELENMTWAEQRAESRAGIVECGNWLLYLAETRPVDLMWVRPENVSAVNFRRKAFRSQHARIWGRWLHESCRSYRYKVDRVFFCRSGSWVHKSLDGAMREFLRLSGMRLKKVGPVDILGLRKDVEKCWWQGRV